MQVTGSSLMSTFIFTLKKNNDSQDCGSASAAASPSPSVAVSSTSHHGDPDPNNSMLQSQPEQRCVRNTHRCWEMRSSCF